jgi:hypothetical protein
LLIQNEESSDHNNQPNQNNFVVKNIIQASKISRISKVKQLYNGIIMDQEIENASIKKE